MKRWAVLVAVLYALMLGVLSMPVLMAAFYSFTGVKDFQSFKDQTEAMEALRQSMQIYSAWQWWLWLVIMGLAQAAMLAAPLRLASRRPMARHSLATTVLTGGLMMGCLVAGALYSIYEFLFRDKAADNDLVHWLALVLGLAAWAAWALIFFLLSRKRDPRDLISRQCDGLLKGSILELLIAVPTHVVARSRDYCCAGFLTFIGLTAGLSVMLFSFGPGVFFLFAARWRRLHPESEAQVSGPR